MDPFNLKKNDLNSNFNSQIVQTLKPPWVENGAKHSLDISCAWRSSSVLFNH